MNSLLFENDIADLPEGTEQLLQSVAGAAMAEEGVTKAYAFMRFVDNDTIRTVNREQRDTDRVTDVLSFPSCTFRHGTARDNPAVLRREYDPSEGAVFLGDILLCVDRAREQAAEYGHSLRRELAYLTAHAMFHLMGYDHMTETDKSRMRMMEESALARLGIRRETEMTGGADMSGEELFARALEMTGRSYAPYSDFHVGACLLADDGRTFDGCNFENAAFGAGTCAERVAIGSALAAGARRFTAIAIAARDGGGNIVEALPCGICRQALNEFCDDMNVYTGTGAGSLRCTPLSVLLPLSFGPDDLKK